MKLIAPLGSDLSEEEEEINVKSGKKRKGKGSSEDSDTCKTPETSCSKNLRKKKPKNSNVSVNNSKTKTNIKSEKQEKDYSNKKDKNKSDNKKECKKSSRSTLSSDSEKEILTCVEKRTIINENKQNAKNVNKSVKNNTLDSDESDSEITVNNHTKNDGKSQNKKATKVRPNKYLGSDSDDDDDDSKIYNSINKNLAKKSTNKKDKSRQIKKETKVDSKQNSESDSDDDPKKERSKTQNLTKKSIKEKKRENERNTKLKSKHNSNSDSDHDSIENTNKNQILLKKSTEEKCQDEKFTSDVTNEKKKDSCEDSNSSHSDGNEIKNTYVEMNKKTSSKNKRNQSKNLEEKTEEESDVDGVVKTQVENVSPKKFESFESSSEGEMIAGNKKSKKTMCNKSSASNQSSSKTSSRSQRVSKNVKLLESSDEENKSITDKGNNQTLLLESSDDETDLDKRKEEVTKGSLSGSIQNLSSSESSDEAIFRKKKTKKEKSKASDSDFEEDNAKDKANRKKRKLVRCASSSNNSDDSENEKGGKSHKSPGKSPGKGRKNIKKIKKDLADSTKEAAEEEKERRKRIEERQKLFNQVFEAKETETLDKLVLDFDPENKKELLSVNRDLVAKMKPHQAKGVQFMWNSCFESIQDCKKKKGSGCILAHCMGLGKTFQVISLVHTLLMNEETQVRTVMVVCPLSTVLNWFNEFDKWLDHIEGGSSIDVYHLTRLKNNPERARELRHWQDTGGVLILGYEMFRNLTTENTKKFRAKIKKDFQETLVDPGADIIVCDEGHMLKNEQTALSKAMGRVKTLRRIVLTGTPMQNNLVEYHCMVQFVKPNLLGTRKEFLNRFVNPITNGQFVDSTERDVSIMKRRAHVLHKMLEGLVQRFDYNVLTPFLPPKNEYVISICLSELQVKMYQHYLDNYSQRSDKEKAGSRLFQDWQALGRIWTHPRVVKMSTDKAAEKRAMQEESDDTEGSLKDFIDDSDEETSSSGSESASSGRSGSIKSDSKKKRVVQTRRKTRSNAKNDAHLESEEEENEEKEVEEIPEKENAGSWWSEFLKPEDLDDIRHSGKLMLLFGILKECELIEDKVLVFSQSLFSLDLIEYFLDRIDSATQEDRLDESLGNHQGTWSKGLDYFRLDGSTSSDNRNLWCKAFNREDNSRARLFLISTRAGGLGINLTAANRVIIFDASWNPSHDVQSIFRVYRFGQKKPCYVYRFIAHGTMEEKVYDRQVAKQSMSNRVVDEQQVHRHFTSNDLNELYSFTPPSKPEDRPIPALPKDVLMAELLAQFKEWIEKYHEHDSLLENVAEEELNEEERKLAWEDYETEKKRGVMPNYGNNAAGAANNSMHIQIEILRRNLKAKYPDMPEPELNQLLVQQVSMLMRQQHMIQQQQQRLAQQQFAQQQMAAQVMQMRQQQQQTQLQMKQMYQKVPPGVFMNQQTALRSSSQPSLLNAFLNMPRQNMQMPRMNNPYPQMTPNFKEMENMRQKYMASKNPGVVITEITDDNPKPSSS